MFPTGPAAQLSLERAREFDRVCEVLAAEQVSINAGSGSFEQVDLGLEARRQQFDKKTYRQPVLAAKPSLPMLYRRDQMDPLTEECRTRLRHLQAAGLEMEEGRETDSLPASPLT